MDKPDRLCFDCKHMKFWRGSPGYGDSCPGSRMILLCSLEKWTAEYMEEEHELGDAIRSAATCEKFEERER